MIGQIGYQVGYVPSRSEAKRESHLPEAARTENLYKKQEERVGRLHQELLLRNRISGGIDFLGGVFA